MAISITFLNFPGKADPADSDDRYRREQELALREPDGARVDAPLDMPNTRRAAIHDMAATYHIYGVTNHIQRNYAYIDSGVDSVAQ